MELKRSKLWVALAVLAVLMLSVVTALADEIIENGTFDTDMSGWDWYHSSWVAEDHTGNSGGGAAVAGSYEGLENCVFQNITGDINGQAGTASLSFWVQPEYGSGTVDIAWLVVDNGDVLIDYGTGSATDGWENITVPVIDVPADTVSVMLALCNMVGSVNPRAVFDDVSLDWQPGAPTPTPEVTPTATPPTFNELTNYSITVYGLIAIALVFSEQIGKIIYVWMWRANKK